jgi:hypothetical protein
VDEFVQSDTALRLGIHNDLPIIYYPAATETAAMLERIRAYLSERHAAPVPMSITSGYRCLALNRAIGSADTSDHIKALAADFKAPVFGTPYEVSKLLSDAMDFLRIGQLIYEHTWIHVSTRTPEKILNRILTVQGKDYITGVVNGT